ncbi:hypothetical protein [Aquimarina algicola]|uniref:Uncharacterized protein n=1 Tax=Aquimarina algicola TaxID=2589995 RepID=A0A504JMM1_9FLAO|nr:hypothetical protein [Aquimarina algicola]TPN87951.1 hypothetical protein FHK87_10280 [Aquimarina algicola]
MKRLKIVLFFVIVTICIGCDLNDDDNTNFSYQLVKIEEVDLPEEFIRGKTYDIEVSYFRPTNCHSFEGFDFTRSENIRTIGAIHIVLDREDCENLQDETLSQASFRFFVGEEESYVFRFWQGRNEEGENQFLIIEIPVVAQS